MVKNRTTLRGTNPQKKLAIYGNLLLNSEDKFEMFRFSLPLWISYWQADSFLRIRGKFATQAKQFCKSLPGVEVRLGSEYRTWRWQTLDDLRLVTAPYIFQYVEDHMPSPEAHDSIEVLTTLQMGSVDALQYSWFEPSSSMRDSLPFESGEIPIRFQYISKAYAVKNFSKPSRYLVSLISVWRRDFYQRILVSHRPFLQRYDLTSPAGIEQRVSRMSSPWFCPMVFAMPSRELGICIDDPLGVPGSDAISRNLYAGNKSVRSSTVLERVVGLRWPDFFAGSNKASRAGVIPNKAKSLIEVLLNSIYAAMLSIADYRTFKMQSDSALSSRRRWF